MKRIAVKLSVFISIILCFTLTVFAEALSPAEARKESMGTTVTVTGYAFSSTDTNSVGFVNEFYLSDARAAGICVVPSGSVSVSLYKEYSVTGTLSRVNGEIKLTNASVTPLPGTISRKYYRLTYEEALDYENYGGTFARLIGTAASPVIENNVLKSFLLTNGESTIKVIIPDNVLSLSKGASGKAELTELLRYKRTVTVDGFVAKIGTETVIRIKDCDDIDVQEHTCVFGEAVTEKAPSCGIAGLSVKVCDCGKRLETVLPALEHSFYEVKEKAPTCTENGLSVKLCKNCSFREETVIGKTEHNYKERTEREPSCSLEGIRVRYCSGCDFREEIPIAKTNHTYKERVEKEATCTTDGVNVKYCSKCDFVAERFTIPKTGHNYKERTEREPSCSLEGIRVRYCSGCDFREETPIAKTNHTYKERVEKEATCTTDGVKVKYCSKCDFVAERFTIPKTGHNYKERTEREPSCSLEGIRVRYCSGCDFREETPIAKTNHSYKERVEKEATCTADGVKVKYCYKCDFVAERFTIPKTGHSIKEKVERESTCTTEGKAVKYCQNCDFREESVIPKKEHTVKTKTEVSATCTTEGKAVKYCQNCNFREESVLPKTGHNYVDKLKKATFTDDGYIYKECKNCKNITEKTVISAVTDCSLSKESFVYDGKKHSVTVTLKDRNGKKITDFNCFGNEGKDIGKYTVTVELKGNYSGKKSFSFSVVPGNPTDLKAVVIANQVTLTFKGTAGADGYRVYYQKGTKLESLGTTTKTSCSFALPDYGKSYTLVIKSYKKSGDTTLWSSGVKTTISSGPHNVTGIKGNSNYYKIKLSWDKTETADGYRVYIKIDGKYKVLTTTEKTSFTVSPLKSDTKYTFAVKAYRKVNGKTLWGKATKKTVTTLSGKPASFSAKESYYTVDLSWREVKGAEGYKVYVYNAKKKKYVTLKSVTSNKYTAENLNSGTTYKFAVKPYAKDGKKIRYGEAVYLTVTTRLKTPSLSVTAKSKGNTLSWKKVNGASGYEIYCCYEKNGKYKKLKTTDKLSFNHTGVSKVCYYKVRAYKVVGKEKLYSSFSTVKKAAR